MRTPLNTPALCLSPRHKPLWPRLLACVGFAIVTIAIGQAEEPILEFAGSGDQVEKLGEPPFSIHAEVDYSGQSRPNSGVPQLRCAPLVEGKLQKSTLLQPRLYEADFSCDINDKPLFIELEARYMYRDKDGETHYKSRHKILNAFFHLVEPDLISSTTSIRADEPQDIYLFASTRDDPRRRPLPTGVDITLSDPSSKCLVLLNPQVGRKMVLSGVTGETPRFPVRVTFWRGGSCELTFKATVEYETHSMLLPVWTVKIPVEPAYFAILIMISFGAFSAFFIVGAVQWISSREEALLSSSASAITPTTLRAIYIGSSGTRVASVLVRIAIALVATTVLSMDKLGIKADFTSIWGYFTLGFVFGLWPLDTLFQYFKERLGGPSSDTTKGKGEKPEDPADTPKPSAEVAEQGTKKP